MIPPRRPWVLQCGECRRIRRIVRDAWLLCDTCDVPIPITPEEQRA